MGVTGAWRLIIFLMEKELGDTDHSELEMPDPGWKPGVGLMLIPRSHQPPFLLFPRCHAEPGRLLPPLRPSNPHPVIPSKSSSSPVFFHAVCGLIQKNIQSQNKNRALSLVYNFGKIY